jgi:TDG/mug DNA glycosylase family protein
VTSPKRPATRTRKEGLQVASIDPKEARRLRDVVVSAPRLLLVGINPGLRSGAVGHHFAGNGNPFWRLLHAARLTPVLIDYAEDQRLAEFGIALTNLCPRTTRTAAELTRAEIARGHVVLERKIGAWRPAVVAFVGVSLYRTYFGVADGPGPGPKRERIAASRVFVVPNPSGLNASFPGFDSKLIWFKRLRVFVDRLARHGRQAAKAVD